MRAALPRRFSRLAALFLAACLASLLGPGAARAVVSDVHLVDGPSADVLEAGDAAMSEDGTGGLVYLKKVDGRNHVFVAQFAGGAWRPPRRVDVGQSFDSSWPRIGAGDGGRLLVTWVQEFGVESDRMFSATLDPGATSFQAPVPVDLNVGEATSTYPDLAMNRGGQAYLVYRVVTDVSPSNPDGYIGADTRVARYGARLWSVLGTPVDRNVATPVREPSAENAPEVGIDIQGQGVVAWQEPDDEFVDRVWVRRLFGSSVSIPIQATPSSWEGTPLRGPADAFALDVAGFGQTAVAFRQQPGQASKLTAPRSMVNEMPDVFSESAQKFAGAQLVDGGVRGSLGTPSVGVDPRGLYLSAFGEGSVTLLARGDEAAPIGVTRLDEGRSSVPGGPLVDLAESGAGVAAWVEQQGPTGLVVAQERRADGVEESTSLTAPKGGAVSGLVMGGSGLGDTIVAWRQGGDANAQLAVAVVDAPPDPFLVLLPNGWQRKKKVKIAWDHSSNAIGGVRYSVSVDDEPVREGLHTLSAVLKADDLDNGRHRIQIFATDDLGQETGSRSGVLLVDRRAPRVKLRRKGRRVTVVVSDGTKKTASTLRKQSVKVSFGERGGVGASASAAGRKKKAKPSVVRVRHAYKGSGRFRIRVSARDRAGNRTSWTKAVRVR
ncbi:MAG TPA: hypothetical protein VFY75_04445 [Solirubrobacterales bacterium]|nr:hypothetical protein [Solirubrobacterales bacterium]